MALKVELNKKYRIKGKSKYFKDKYGTCNPFITIEDTDINIFGGKWIEQNGNPACCLFGLRAGMESLPVFEGSIYYGKISVGANRGALGELVHETELEEV